MYGDGILYSGPTVFSNELVTNGGFDTDSNWTKGTGWVIANGKATLTNGTDPTYQIFQVISGLNTKKLKVSFDITNFSGDAEIRYPLRENITENGSYVFYGVGTFDRVQFQAKSGSTTSFNVDNVSVVEVTQGSDFEFTRSTTGTRINEEGYIEDVPYNLFTHSETFSNWAKTDDISGPWFYLYNNKWTITIIFTILFGYVLFKFFFYLSFAFID